MFHFHALRIRAAALILIASVTSWVANAATSPTAAEYHVVHGWPELPPGEILGQATGVDTDSQHNVWVFHRADRLWTEPFPKEPIAGTTLWVLDPTTGRRMSALGAGRFIMPHGLTIDADDNVWVTDVGLHQVFKLAPDGSQLLVLGEAGVAGDDSKHFNMPTDVAISPNGDVFVSDGYGNARVVKFDSEGKFLRTWGTRGHGPGELDTPHGIALDAAGRVLVADRANSRVQIFDQSGKFIAQWKDAAIGRPYAVAPASDGHVLIADGGDQPASPPDRGGVAMTDSDGHVLGRFGRFGNYDGQFRLAHDLAVAADGSILVVDAWGQRVQRFVANHEPAAVKNAPAVK
ncbi:MAG: peptidyl-alpha-hydroxyglycine alpha-amidating lyase family protein [Lysobacterales bacterium]